VNTQLVYRGDRRFELADAELGPPGSGEVVLEVIAAGICGSDVHGYAGLNDRRPAGTVMGHEVVGRIAALGPGAALGAGDVVSVWPIVACGTCDLCATGRPHLCLTRRLIGCTPELPGGFAQRMTVPEANLVPLPAGVPASWGALVEPLAVGYHAVSLAGDTLGARVGVIGGGPIGIAAGLAAQRRGAEVVVLEPIAERRAVLDRLGLEAVAPEAAPRALDTVLECVGRESTIRAALAATSPGGTVVCVGIAEPEVSIPIVPLVIEERRLLGSSAYTHADFLAVARSFAGEGADLGVMVEATTDLAGAPQAFAGYAGGSLTAVKTLVFPNDVPA
jgi:threonine dehydrogenase-like Zn-dependent dehydrogenase